MKQAYLFLLLPIFTLLLFPTHSIFAQTTSLSGVINSYYSVQSIHPSGESLTLSSSAGGFQTNDEVLIIQMQGGNMDTSNDANFGTITQLGSTGLMERATVCSTSGNELTFQHILKNTYDEPSAKPSIIQVIKFETYQDVRVTGTLTAPVWNGSTGGVLVLAAHGDIQLQADINVSGLGFRGGAKTTMASGCANFPWPSFEAYAYAESDQSGAKKGEGIIPYAANKEFGKGPHANGGGGANDHNAGGAGGANWGAGGQGGEKTTGGSFICLGNEPGLGGNGLQSYLSSSNLFFMGGGGGAGNDNDGQSGAAGNGGGIAIILADDLEGNGFRIYARGEDAGASTGDGGSGGGAGGSIFLSTNSFGTNSLWLDVSGGKGGNAGVAANCLGPGGGGGGGLIRTASALTSNVRALANGGDAGIVNTNVVLSCAGGNNFARDGQNGFLIQSATVPAGTLNGSCVLAAGTRDNAIEDKLPIDTQISIYPNPSKSGESIQFAIESPESTWLDLRLLDGSGRSIYQRSRKIAAGREIEHIPNVNLSEGIYYLRVIVHAKLYSYPIVVGN